MNQLTQKIKNIPRYVWVLLLIILLGTFLRTYHFHDWMRFSMDQSRDATIISNAIKGRKPLPLLGPDAGNTKFLLGPMYYDLSYISAKIFGNYPDKMAYPSLLSGILAIPFLFLFLREYFDRKISLALTAVMSVSYFMISASRFSSNPNLAPLFIILFLWGLLKILNNPQKFHPGWSALVGFSLGIGIQMHATMLIVMPIVGFLVLAYLWKKSAKGIWKSLVIVILLVALFNIGQIKSEFNTNFKNTHHFFQGLKNKSENNYGEGLFLISACQIEANGYILSSVGNDYQCSSIFKISRQKQSQSAVLSYFLVLTIYTLFSMVGYYFLIRRLWKEKEIKQKNFLGLILFFNLVTAIIFMRVSNSIHIQYYIVLFFVPFVLLGILLEEANKKYGRKGMLATGAIISILVVCSLIADGNMAISYAKGLQNNESNSTLSQGENMASYIIETVPSDVADEIYFTGRKRLAKRYYAPISYLVKRAGYDISLKRSFDPAKLLSNHPLYYVDKTGHNLKTVISGHLVISHRKFFNQTIYTLKN